MHNFVHQPLFEVRLCSISELLHNHAVANGFYFYILTHGKLKISAVNMQIVFHMSVGEILHIQAQLNQHRLGISKQLLCKVCLLSQLLCDFFALQCTNKEKNTVNDVVTSMCVLWFLDGS
jgi:hypothetical protein